LSFFNAHGFRLCGVAAFRFYLGFAPSHFGLGSLSRGFRPCFDGGVSVGFGFRPRFGGGFLGRFTPCRLFARDLVGISFYRGSERRWWGDTRRPRR
jgi:hypothetical protein